MNLIRSVCCRIMIILLINRYLTPLLLGVEYFFKINNGIFDAVRMDGINTNLHKKCYFHKIV
jgi:hypothetical protein